jgi:CheY-like chemotaxis protein
MHLALRTEMTTQQRDFISKAEHSAETLLGILNEILDFSKIEADKLSLEEVEFDLHKVLDHLVTVISERLHDKDIEFIICVAHDVPTQLWGDPLRLGQVLINLAGNATKFTHTGEIRVSVRLQAPVEDNQVRLLFEILDTGIGMDAEQMKGLFNPFTQADTSTTRQFGGTGLGLSISQRLVRLMEGDIKVESALGKGSVFSFDAQFKVTDAILERAFSEDVRRLKVLVVDDRASAGEALQEALRTLGIVSETASSGVEALSILGSASTLAPFDLVFIDKEMPEMDGLEVSRILSSDPDITHKPVVVLAQTKLPSETREKTDGHFLAVQKPITFTSLTSLLKDLVSAQETSPPKIPAATADQNDLSPHFTGRKLLLVEDNDVNQLVGIGMLENAGFEVRAACNGQEAVDLVASGKFDAVLMDIQMPVMDGLEATRRIRKLPGCSELPIIALTALATKEDQEMIISAGMNDHLFKPIDFKVLFDVLSRRLGQEGKKDPFPVKTIKTPATVGIGTVPAIDRLGSNHTAFDSSALVEGLQELLPVLRTCKPRQSKTLLEKLHGFAWPGQTAKDMRKLSEFIDRYQFAQAQELVESLLVTIGKMRDSQ